ncbi:MAG: NADH-quinone oxidoreductase subunit N [Phototrophicales bacterium]|nr:MAG: NADH-quinone oxidoreductase subunit N [Phototrophicales bacterium]
MFSTPTFDELNVWVTLPVISLALGTCIMLLVDVLLPKNRKVITAWLAAIGVGVSLVLSFFQASDLISIGEDGTAFEGLFVADQFTYVVNIIVLLATLIGIMVAYEYLKRTGMERGEFYALMLFSAVGAMLMGATRNLVLIFIALELLSIPLYVLSGFRRPKEESEESAMKYFLLGAFASGFLVYGIAFIYGATGSFEITEIWTSAVDILNGDAPGEFTLLIGVGLIIIALGFKVGAVPFHMWQPDVYQGAPTPVTAFMSVAAKAGGFAAMLRVLATGSSIVTDADLINIWQDTVQIIALATLVLGNFVALMQTDLKRLLAYSSIAHGGYILIAVAAGGSDGVGDMAAQAGLIYLLAYTFTNIGAFAVVAALERDDATGTSIDDVKGLALRNPGLAAMMTIFMFSLTGVPLTAGFMGKWFVFRAALEGELYWLAVAGILTSVVSAYYYLRVVVNMYMIAPDEGAAPQRIQPVLRSALVLTAAGTLVFGILPYLLSDITKDVTLAIIGFIL